MTVFIAWVVVSAWILTLWFSTIDDELCENCFDEWCDGDCDTHEDYRYE